MAGDVDPRFDPQFQRGYDPSRHAPRTPRRAAAEPVVQPVEPPAEPQERHDEPAERHDEPQEPPVSAAGPIAEVDDAEPARTIPFRLILLIASIAAIAGSAILLWARITEDPLNQYYGSNQGILFRDQFMDSLMAPLLIAGSTGLVLWLALGALRGHDDE